MPSPEEIVYQSRRFAVVRSTFTTGQRAGRTREWIRHPGAVAIVPILADGRVCLIENHRTAVRDVLVEIPAGTREPDEEPLSTAHRELQEETGYTAGRMELVHEFYTSPGVMNEKMYLFRATELTEGPPERESSEQIENRVVPWEEAVAMARDGRIQDAKTLVGLLLCEQLRREGR